MASVITNSLSKSLVFSYHKNHQELVLKIYNYFKRKNLPVWIDIEDGMNKNQDERIHMIENIIGFVCFLSPMYESSKRCQEEIEFAKNERIPLIVCRLLPNWKPSGWLNQITNDLSIIDLRDLNQRNFEEKIQKLERKLRWLLDNGRNSPIISHPPSINRSIVFDNDSLREKIELTYLNKQPINYRILPTQYHNVIYLSNIMICSNEYILINANNYLHLFDKHLQYIRSNSHVKINENNLRDLIWCADLNRFLILTRKQIYLMNPLTCQLSFIDKMKFMNDYEEFLSCDCSEKKFFLITFHWHSQIFYYYEYYLPTFRFHQKIKILDLIGTSLFVQNGSLHKYHIEQVTSIRYFQQKIALILRIASKWFIHIFAINEQITFLQEISLEEKCRMTILNPIHQWIIFTDVLSNSFIQMNLDFTKKSSINQANETLDYSKGFIHFGKQLRSVALLGTSNLVLLIDNALVLYKL